MNKVQVDLTKLPAYFYIGLDDEYFGKHPPLRIDVKLVREIIPKASLKISGTLLCDFGAPTFEDALKALAGSLSAFGWDYEFTLIQKKD